MYNTTQLRECREREREREKDTTPRASRRRHRRPDGLDGVWGMGKVFVGQSFRAGDPSPSRSHVQRTMRGRREAKMPDAPHAHRRVRKQTPTTDVPTTMDWSTAREPESAGARRDGAAFPLPLQASWSPGHGQRIKYVTSRCKRQRMAGQGRGTGSQREKASSAAYLLYADGKEITRV